MSTIEASLDIDARGEAPTRKERRKAEKAAAKLERKLAKAQKKAWKRARPKKTPWVTPILWVSDVRGHAGWLERAFGFEVAGIHPRPDGKGEHAMLRHRRGAIMLGNAADPATMGPPAGKVSCTSYVYVADVDDLAVRAAAAGGKILFPPKDEPWGDRCVGVVDPEGHSWMFATSLGTCPMGQTGEDGAADGCADDEARQAKA